LWSGLGSVSLLITVLSFASSFSAPGQFTPTETISGRSLSGQFIIHFARAPWTFSAVAGLQTNRDYVRLDPALLPVSCERLKEAIWRDLGTAMPWRGKIFLSVLSATTGDDPVTLTCGQFTDGWTYQLALPEFVQRAKFIRVMTQTLLLEFANRTAQEHSADLPAWLVEGFAQRLLASSDRDLVLSAPQASANGMKFAAAFRDARRTNSLEGVHALLAAEPPLSFEELSWPDPERLTRRTAAVFAGSAQLFVEELLKLPDGKACLRGFLSQLPEHYNWQYAFLNAFRTHFTRPLDVEKWWALQQVHFTGRAAEQTWDAEESWSKLDQAIRSAIEVRIGTNDLPLHAEVQLQTILGEWDSPRQVSALSAKLGELNMVRQRVAKDYLPLVDEYRQVLQSYLQSLEKGGSVIPFRNKAVHRRAKEDVLARLNALDTKMKSAKPAEKPRLVIQAEAKN